MWMAQLSAQPAWQARKGEGKGEKVRATSTEGEKMGDDGRGRPLPSSRTPRLDLISLSPLPPPPHTLLSTPATKFTKCTSTEPKETRHQVK